MERSDLCLPESRDPIEVTGRLNKIWIEFNKLYCEKLSNLPDWLLPLQHEEFHLRRMFQGRISQQVGILDLFLVTFQQGRDTLITPYEPVLNRFDLGKMGPWGRSFILYGVVLYPSFDINSPLPDLAPSVSGSWSNDPEGIMGQKCEKISEL